MNWIKRAFVILLVLQARAAMAFPADGSLKELGETPLKDEISASALAAPATAEKRAEERHSLSNYGQLDPFDEIAILQRKFLPKRHRFELSATYGSLVDNAFFDTHVFYARLGYGFWEALSVEALYFHADTKLSNMTDNLYRNGGVVGAVAAVPSSYIGADAKWSPIYGKLAFWNSHIVPVEQFFLLGGGQTKLGVLKSAPTVHAGTGFSFGLLKWLAVRVGLDLFTYKTEAGDHFTDTHLNVGFSGFFPGADYR